MRVLLVFTTSGWLAPARMPQALAAAGFSVAALTPSDHVVTRCTHLDHAVTLTSPVDLPTFHRALANTVAQWRPDLVLAADDPALWLLHRLLLDPNVEVVVPPLARVLAASLSRPEAALDIERKSVVYGVAHALGIAVPPMVANPIWEEAIAFANLHGFPVMVKVDRTWGGQGIRVCRDTDALRQALDWTPDTPSFEKTRGRTVQKILDGAQYVAGYAAWQGRLLACLPLVKVTSVAGGGSAVVRPIDDARVLDAVRRLVAHFGCSGFGDVEFCVDKASDTPCFLEINPRIVPSISQGRLFGVDLCGALKEAMDGHEGVLRLPTARDLHVATFPFEWMRDPSSPYLQSAHHDVPWDDPPLLCEMLRRAAEARGLMGGRGGSIQ